VRTVPDSDTYLAILDEGRSLQARRLLLRRAERRLGRLDKAGRDCLECITDLERLDRIHDRAALAANWQDLLDTP
jgi:hypothetical protein